MKRKTHTIDASDKALGRVAKDVALLLRGKEKPEFAPHVDSGDFVVVQNVKQVRFSGKKLAQKKYYRHSGYLGGLRTTTLQQLFGKAPEEVLRKAVMGMLPKNKLRDQQIKRLTFAK